MEINNEDPETAKQVQRRPEGITMGATKHQDVQQVQQVEVEKANEVENTRT